MGISLFSKKIVAKQYEMCNFEETVKIDTNLACVQVFQIQTETRYQCAYSKLRRVMRQCALSGPV